MQRHAKERHRADEKNHKCVLCLKSFPTSQQLTQHSLVHSNVRKYPCHYCDKSFKQLSHVQQHQRIHTGSSLLFSSIVLVVKFPEFPELPHPKVKSHTVG